MPQNAFALAVLLRVTRVYGLVHVETGPADVHECGMVQVPSQSTALVVCAVAASACETAYLAGTVSGPGEHVIGDPHWLKSEVALLLVEAWAACARLSSTVHHALHAQYCPSLAAFRGKRAPHTVGS